MVIYKLNINDGEIMNSIFVVVHVNEAEEFLEDYLESIKEVDKASPKYPDSVTTLTVSY